MIGMDEDSKPYLVLKEEGSTEYRLFSKYNPRDLYWHRDKEDRLIKVVMGEVEFQVEDSLPVEMRAGDSAYCPKETFHRIINNEGTPFVLEVNKLADGRERQIA